MLSRLLIVPLMIGAWAAGLAARAGSVEPVEGYGLIQSYGMGYGGMITVDLKPAVLFKSGELLTKVGALADPAGLAADRRANPSHWSRWRRGDGAYEYLGQKGTWKTFYGGKVWNSAPTTGLAGTFTRTGGGGDLAQGGTSAVFTQTRYQFLSGGRLVREGLASASTEVEGGGAKTRATTAGRSGERAGRYTVSGLTMTVAYDDGGRETLILMTHPTDPNILWLNGLSFVRRKP